MGKMLKPVFLSGLILGIAASIPIMSMGCCLWALGGGLLAVLFYRKFNNEEVDNGTGAILGLLCGLIALPIATILVTLFGLLFQSAMLSFMTQLFGNAGIEDLAMEGLMETPSVIYSLISNLISYTLIFGIFSTLGGLLGAVIFNKSKKQGPEQGTQAQTTGQLQEGHETDPNIPKDGGQKGF